jgi:RimJ/RimL family protein N-acetyltransferase
LTLHQIRPIRGLDELDLFNRLPYVLNSQIAGDFDAGRRRPEWLWVALRDDRLMARAAWWARAGDDTPFLMDVFDIDDDDPDRIDIGVQLLETAFAEIAPAGAHRPEFLRFIPNDWRDDEQTRGVVQDRMTALERVGAKLFVERLRLDWSPGTPIPEPSRRLGFRPVRDASELIELMTQVLDGSLDAHSRDELTRITAAEAARRQYDEELARYASPHDWWRIAETPDGDPVGFVIPAHNGYSPVIAYIGVLPAHRGHGYIDDILAEGTRILAAQDVPRIRAATDLGNVPMARSFARLGYTTFERQIDLVWR